MTGRHQVHLRLRRQLLHHVEDVLEVGAAGLEVELEEQLGETGVGVALDVLADLGERAPERAAVSALGGIVDHVRATADDVERIGIAADLPRGVFDLSNECRTCASGTLPPLKASPSVTARLITVGP